VFLKIYLYGYLNGSGRDLERNVEKHGNAMAFRSYCPITTAYPILEKQSYCLEKLFKLYVLFKRCRFDEVAKPLLSTVPKAEHNSKKANFNQRKSTNM
jgi:hypothetical protein